MGVIILAYWLLLAAGYVFKLGWLLRGFTIA
jgi:hypothetical protein